MVKKGLPHSSPVPFLNTSVHVTFVNEICAYILNKEISTKRCRKLPDWKCVKSPSKMETAQLHIICCFLSDV